MLSLNECERLFNARQFSESLIESLRYHVSQNSGAAYRMLSFCYGDGKCVPKDMRKRAELLVEAVKLGDISAMGTMAYSLRNGSGGFTKNEALAHQLEGQAFQLSLSKAYTDPMAAYTVGRCFYYGDGGVDKDYEKAYEYLTVSSRLGSSDALVLLASMYQFGKYVRKDISEARRLLQKAVSMGNQVAAIDLKYL